MTSARAHKGGMRPLRAIEAVEGHRPCVGMSDLGNKGRPARVIIRGRPVPRCAGALAPSKSVANCFLLATTSLIPRLPYRDFSNNPLKS